ncbi:MAG: transcriptional regulator, partial [Actinomycetota bacterium]
PVQGVTPRPPTRRPIRRRANSFRREGDYWSISYAGQAFRLKDSKGLRYMAKLLAEPGREFHVLDLVTPGGLQVPSQSVRASMDVTSSGGSTEVIDPTARQAYRARLEELREELAEAERWGDAARAGRARDEIDFLAAELKRTTGLGGRGRAFTSESERARVSVTRVIKAALLRIGDNSPELKHHFGATLKTGTYCSYAPDPRLPARWDL